MLRGGYYTFKTNYILPFPVPENITLEISSSVEKLTKSILDKKQLSPKNDIKKEEKEIDNIIYKLYNLTTNEINEIEGQ
ncbi:MAG: class I SAM-dependent DNA methyltransferase [Bacteroidia bacterium]